MPASGNSVNGLRDAAGYILEPAVIQRAHDELAHGGTVGKVPDPYRLHGETHRAVGKFFAGGHFGNRVIGLFQIAHATGEIQIGV